MYNYFPYVLSGKKNYNKANEDHNFAEASYKNWDEDGRVRAFTTPYFAV